MKNHPYAYLVANLLRLGGNLCHLVSMTILESIGETKKVKNLERQFAGFPTVHHDDTMDAATPGFNPKGSSKLARVEEICASEVLP